MSRSRPVRIGINGMGRMGRLMLRAAWDFDPAAPATLAAPGGAWGRGEIDVVHVNEPHGDAPMVAHLLAFDSVYGRWPVPVAAHGEDGIAIAGRRIGCTGADAPGALDWGALGVDLVVECSGRFKTREALEPYLHQGVRKVVVSAPVKGEALNVVMGVNHGLYDPARHELVTAASCTTNCLAPVVKVVHEGIGIRHGMITTIHDVTNTQTVHDRPMKDMRRARSALLNLVPTSTGSATAITLIFPELAGKLDGVAVRVPLLNASLTDCVFELARETSVQEVNGLLEAAAAGPLAGILGVERRPLVSTDFRGDRRSCVVDAPSTMVTGGTQVKILAWYDNEMGYACRLRELAEMVAGSLSA